MQDIDKKHIEHFKNKHGNKYTYGDFRIIFASNRKQKQIHITCNTCGCNWWCLVQNHKKGSGCAICAKDNAKDTLEEVQSKLKNNNINKILKLYEKNGVDYLDILCNIHNIVFTRRKDSALASNSCMCPECFKESFKTKNIYNKKTYEGMKEELEKLGNFIVISHKEQYSNYRGDVWFRCLDCGNEWHNSPCNIKAGNGCGICSRKKIKKYNKVTAYRHKEEWKQEDMLLYILKCYNDIESFYKIGVTVRTITERYPPSSMPYQFKILYVYKGNKFECVILEDELLQEHRHCIYKPEIDFGGKTECVSYVDMNNIEKRISAIIHKLK